MVNRNFSDDSLPPACKLIPAWFSERMMTDEWSFGVLLITGQVLAVKNISDITRDASGGIWIDFDMLENVEGGGKVYGDAPGPLVYSPTERTTVSVNARHVVAVFELADT